MASASSGESVHTGSREAPSTPIESGGKGFSELVRAGCEDYVLQGIGLPIAAYVFHAVKLCLFVLGWMFFVQLHPGPRQPLGRRLVVARGHRVPEGVPLGLPRRGARLRLHERPARLPHLAAVHRLPALPASGHDQAGAVPEPAAVRRHDAHLARRRALRRLRRVAAARAGGARRSARRSSCRSSSCCRSARSPTRRSCSPRASSITSR